MSKIFSPSMMCANFGCLQDEVKSLEEAGASRLHIDIMDGIFVPNFGMGLQDTELICKITELPVEVHLMIENPINYVEKFIDIGTDIVYIHPESGNSPVRTLQEIKKLGAVPGIAVNPGTTLEVFEELLYYVEAVLVMTVNPGFAGQKFLEPISAKIEKLAKVKNSFNFDIMVDGACSVEIIKKLDKIGADGYILGTSALFGKKQSYSEIFKKLLLI